MTMPAILFDLDGTLLDTAADFTRVLNEMRAAYGDPPLPFEAVRERVSDGARAMVSLGFLVGEDDPLFETRRQEFLRRYEQQLAVDTALFPGMEEVLAFIEASGTPWGIVTNKPALYTDKILLALGLAARCGAAICPDHVTHRKPHPEALYLACKQLRQPVYDAIYVGDHRRDIEAGRRAGMTTVAAAWGYSHADDPPQAWGADHVVANAAGLLPLFERLRRGASC